MAASRVLRVDAHGLTAFIGRGRFVEAEAEFAADGAAAFDAYLRRHGDSDFYLLADLTDEEFEAEDIPPVGGRDRRALIERKLDHLYCDTPLRAALNCGRLKNGRRDERVVFAALGKPQRLEPWLAALAHAGASLAGVFSVAQLVAELTAVRERRQPQLLVMTTTRAGLRQTLLEDGQLRFSRLTPLTGEADPAAVCAAEVAKLKQYLAGRLLAGDAALDVLAIVAEPALRQRYRQCCSDLPGLRFAFADLAEEAGRCGPAANSRHAGIDTLLARLLLRRTPAIQFAPDDWRHHFFHRRISRGMRAAAALLLVGCLLFSGLQLIEARQLREQTESIVALSHIDARKYAALSESLPPLPLPADRLQAVTTRHAELRRHSHGPEAACRGLAAALTDFPETSLDRLAWTAVDGGRSRLEVRAALAPELAGDPRRQLDVIGGLVRRLQAGTGIQVHVLALPFDAASGKALKSPVAASGRPKFALQIRQEK